ncbi:transposase [Bacillus cereus]|nr:transposase [Bacillus cereus]
MKPLINSVIRYTPKRRSLIEDFVFVCIWHEAFLSLLSYVRHDDVLRNERNGASRVDDLAQ